MHLYIAALAAAVTTVFAYGDGQKDPHWANGRNTIVHLFEWKFSDIAEECERFLAPMGYAGVQTSPVNEYAKQPSGFPWWERYQPISYKIISRSGNEEEFADMVKRCNDVGVRVYVDVVINHMCGNVQPSAIGYGGSTADPPNRDYPAVPYTREHFNVPCGIWNYDNATEVRECELSGLPDLNDSHPWVQEKLVEFLDSLVDHGVAGFRVDAAKHMWPQNLESIYARVKNLRKDHGFPENSRPFFYQEVIDMSGTEGVHSYEYADFGVVTEFRVGKELSACFKGNNDIKWLSNFGTAWGLLPSDDGLAFIDNHDNQRSHGGGGDILTYKTPKTYKMAIAFMLAWPYGITRVMSSFAFDDSDQGPPADPNGNILDVTINDDLTCNNGWVCEHRWRQIFNMIQFKNTVQGTPVTDWWDNGKQQISFCRGTTGFVAFNDQFNADLKQTLQTCLPEGIYCDLASGSKVANGCSGKAVEVNGEGLAYIEILNDEKDGFLAITLDSNVR